MAVIPHNYLTMRPTRPGQRLTLYGHELPEEVIAITMCHAVDTFGEQFEWRVKSDPTVAHRMDVPRTYNEADVVAVLTAIRLTC